MKMWGFFMHIHRKIYEFAASAGALAGYVYDRLPLDMKALTDWVDNLTAAYENLPSAVRAHIQDGCDATIGRAIRSLTAVLGETHTMIGKLKSLVAGSLPDSADDFQKTKWFEQDL